jgi:hypothetical protein
MQRLVASALVVCLFASLVSKSVLAKEPPAPNSPVAKPAAAQPADAKVDFIIGDPIRYKNLTVFPVASKLPRTEDRFLTLEEGLKAGTVEVFEVGSQPQAAAPAPARPANAANGENSNQANQPQPTRQRGQTVQSRRSAGDDPFGDDSSGESAGRGAEVNRLMLINKSEKPLYLMPGEIIYGGQQNRTVAVETIIPPDKKPVAIDVYCVEHGRWAARESRETNMALEVLSAESGHDRARTSVQAREQLAEDAKHGKFVAHGGAMSKAGRAAVQGAQGQSQVWDKVAEANAANSNQSRSSDFAENYTDPKSAKQLQAFLDALQKPVAGGKQAVGAIVAVNGTVEAVDVFQSTPLFQKLWPKLLKGYALDAIAGADAKEAKNTCTVKDAETFLNESMRANVEKKDKGQGGLVVTKRDSARVMSFSAGFGGMGGMGGGGFGDADSVHSSGYKK